MKGVKIMFTKKKALYKDEIPEKKYYNFAPFIVLVLIIALLQILLPAFSVPRYIFPTPYATLEKLVTEFGSLWPDIAITLQEIIFGYIIAVPCGMILAILMTQFKIVNRALTPYTIFIATIPMIALVPLLMIWLGFGMNVKVITVALQTFPVIMLNSATGFNNVEETQRELMKSLGASRIQTLHQLIIPSSAKYIFTGLKLGTIFSTIAAICCEFTGSTQGLGFRIFTSISYVRTELAFAGIICIGIIGIIFYNLINFIEQKVTQWVD